MPALDIQNKNSPSKKRVIAALVAQVKSDLQGATATQQATHAGATHEESRAENDKDTRGIEASYLARGLAKRVSELSATARAVASLAVRPFEEGEAASVGAVVRVEDEDGEEVSYLLSPSGGGRSVDVDGATIKVVTPQSPLGRALLGRTAGDDVEVRTPRGVRECTVVAVG